MVKDIALVTDEASLPVDYDMPLLIDACRAIGLPVRVCAWDDARVGWAGFKAILLRSPWSYADRLPEFLRWCERAAASAPLFNPLPVVRWSLDKSYLLDLAACGVPIVPTVVVAPGSDAALAVKKFLAAHPATGEVVVKPAVGAYSKGVQRFVRSREDEAAQHILELFRSGCAVVLQPYLESIDRAGETDLTFFDGAYSHAIRKEPLLMADGTVSVPTFECRSARVADDAEQAVARAVHEAAMRHLGLDRPLLYARIDLVRGDDGRPLVLEAELCEPSLNLSFAGGSAGRFARAIADRLTR